MEYINPNDYWRHQDYDPYNGMNDEERLKAGCWQMVVFIAAVAISMIVCSFFTSCKSVEYVPVIEHHTDTLIQTKVQHDSIYINDSTVSTEKGDTVKIEKWHTKYVEKQVHDTLYIAKNDTVPQPYPVIKEVPAELSWWQQTRLHIANILLWALLIVGIGWIIKKKLLP
jgi:hypothetical protein